MTHPHDLSASGMRTAQRRAVWLALAINGLFVIGEVSGGLAFHSLALVADAAHQATDVVALLMAVVALRLLERPGSARHTFGFQRAEVLAALVNGGLLGGAAVWIAVEAVLRLTRHPHGLHAGGVIVVAAVGLVANVAGALVLGRARGQSLNMGAAAVHLLSDAAALLGTLVAAALVAVAGWQAADPVASLLIAGLALYGSWRLLGATVHVLLEGTPSGLDPAAVERALLAGVDVTGVHHLHLWSLASDVPALSAHVVLAHELSLHEAQARADELKVMLLASFGIDHATLELECHECEAPDDTGRLPSRASGAD